MIKFYNKYIPFEGFRMMMALGICFIRMEYDKVMKKWYRPLIFPESFNHEAIHARQQWETMILTAAVFVILGIVADVNVPVWIVILTVVLNWYVWYGISWLIQLILPPYDTAYRDIVFEVEAYSNEDNLDYLKTRKPFTWVVYMFRPFCKWVKDKFRNGSHKGSK